MQRREFSISGAGLAAAATFGGALSAAGQAMAQGGAPKEGDDFLLLDKQAPTEAPAGKIEVVEFFWYACQHCNRFEPQL